MLRRCACAALRRSKVHCAQVEPAEAVIRAAYPHVGTSRWRSPLGGRRPRRKSSAFSGLGGGPALTRPATCSHMMEVVRPHRPPCDGLCAIGSAADAPGLRDTFIFAWRRVGYQPAHAQAGSGWPFCLGLALRGKQLSGPLWCINPFIGTRRTHKKSITPTIAPYGHACPAPFWCLASAQRALCDVPNGYVDRG